MTITEQKIENFNTKFWNIDTKLGGRTNIRLFQWKFEALLYNNYNDEDEFLKTIKAAEIMNGNSIIYEIFNGKAINELSQKIGPFAVKHLDFDTIEDQEVYYFVAYVFQ